MTECKKDGYHDLIKLIHEVIDKFKFPDGCLDLSGDELDIFINTLAETIKTDMDKKSEESFFGTICYMNGPIICKKCEKQPIHCKCKHA